MGQLGTIIEILILSSVMYIVNFLVCFIFLFLFLSSWITRTSSGHLRLVDSSALWDFVGGVPQLPPQKRKCQLLPLSILWHVHIYKHNQVKVFHIGLWILREYLKYAYYPMGQIYLCCLHPSLHLSLPLFLIRYIQSFS